MGLWDKIRGEFVDILQWTDDSRDTIVWRFERHGNEIKFGAQLVVRESQTAVFVNMGKVADAFPPGMYELETKNLPILSTLQGWKYGFHSPFKAEVYFVNTRRFTDLKWGTKNPVIRRDAEFGPVRLRAFGTYAMRVADAVKFIREIAGTDSRFTIDEIMEQLRNIVVARFSDAVAERAIPVLDLAAHYDEMADFVRQKIAPEFDAYGLELSQFYVENISLPPEVEKAVDARSSMGAIGDLNRFSQFQAAQAMEEAARNPGGMAAGGMGMGMGFAMANQMGQQMAGASQPPPLPGAAAMFYAAAGGVQAGPFDLVALGRKAHAGEITAATLVWRQGMPQWTPAGAVPELAALFPAAPPPLPAAS